MCMRSVVIILALCGLSGCIPFHYTDRPGVTGVVINKRTRLPVEGAEISLGRAGKLAVASSSKDGSFSIPPLKSWGIYVIPYDAGMMSFPLSIKRSGYQLFTRDVMSTSTDRDESATKSLGVINLNPK